MPCAEAGWWSGAQRIRARASAERAAAAEREAAAEAERVVIEDHLRRSLRAWRARPRRTGHQRRHDELDAAANAEAREREAACKRRAEAERGEYMANPQGKS